MIKTDYLSAENFKKTRKLDGSILKPAINHVILVSEYLVLMALN